MSSQRGNASKPAQKNHYRGPRHHKPRAPTSANSNISQESVIAPHIPVSQKESQVEPVLGRHFSAVKFADAPISKTSKDGIKHEFLSDVQAVTLNPALEGHDLLVQAKTGTGKTLAFLLPAIERLAKECVALGSLPAQNQISILVLSPTRELALQIEDEATALLKHHPFSVQHAIGGTNINSELQRLRTKRADVLVATPGRLLDMLSNHELHSHFSNLRTLVLDEADRLLDQGFKRELEKIFTFLPPKEAGKGRQSLLFSATVGEDIKQIARAALRPGYKFLSTLLEDEINTHEHVPQTHLTLPFSHHLPATLTLLREDVSLHPNSSKAMVFFPTARHVGLAAAALERIPGLPTVLSIHSKHSQSKRTKSADQFREAKSAILLSSDVTARGMDFPGVTLVLQVGLPMNPEQYIHRLGRTARAGASGRGVLVLSEPESYFLRLPAISSLGITQHITDKFPDLVVSSMMEVENALTKVDEETKAAAYRSWLGYYKAYISKLRWSPAELVQEANNYVKECLGWTKEEMPGVEPKAVGMMGLKGVPGLRIARRDQSAGTGQRRGAGQRGRGQGATNEGRDVPAQAAFGNESRGSGQRRGGGGRGRGNRRGSQT